MAYFCWFFIKSDIPSFFVCTDYYFIRGDLCIDFTSSLSFFINTAISPSDPAITHLRISIIKYTQTHYSNILLPVCTLDDISTYRIQQILQKGFHDECFDTTLQNNMNHFLHKFMRYTVHLSVCNMISITPLYFLGLLSGIIPLFLFPSFRTQKCLNDTSPTLSPGLNLPFSPCISLKT